MGWQMIVPMSDLQAEYASLRREIDSAMRRVIESGEFVFGDDLKAFEGEFASYCGSRYAVGVGSGTAGLRLALEASGVGPGDEVITVPNTDISTSSAISHCGASLVWVDVDSRTFNIDAEMIEDRISGQTKAILPVHLHGNPADMDQITEIAGRHDLLVIEDAALAIGAEYGSCKVGSMGDVGCFSLAPGKMLGAYGDGGMVVTDSREIADGVRMLRNYGYAAGTGEDLGQILGIECWQLVAEGFNERLDTLQAAIVRAKLPTLENRITRRREIAHRYNNGLAELNLVTPYAAGEARHVYRAYTVLVDDRDGLRRHLASMDIATRVYYVPPLHLQTVYEHVGFELGDFPVTEELAEKMLALPLFPEMTDSQVEQVIEAVEAYLTDAA